MYIDMELVLPMCSVHPYFSLKNSGKKCALYLAKYGITSITILLGLG